MTPLTYTQLEAMALSPEDQFRQLSADHEGLKKEVDNIRSFYSVDKLSQLGGTLDGLERKLRWTSYVQLIVSALTPVITIYIALVTFNASNQSEASRERMERNKLAADLYEKAVASAQQQVMFNTADVLKRIEPNDPTFSVALTQIALHQNQVQAAVAVAATPTSPLSLDTARTSAGNMPLAELKLNKELNNPVLITYLEKTAQLSTQTTNEKAQQLVQQSTLSLHRLSAESERQGFDALLALIKSPSLT